jgi:hypothetical protein
MSHNTPTPTTDHAPESKIELITTQEISLLSRGDGPSSTYEISTLSDGDSKSLLDAICHNDTKSVVNMIERIEAKTMPCFSFCFDLELLMFRTNIGDESYELKYNRYQHQQITQAILFEGNNDMIRRSIEVLRSKMPLDEIYNAGFINCVVSKLLPYQSVLPTNYLSDSLELLNILRHSGFFSRSDGYSYNTVIDQLRQLLSIHYGSGMNPRPDDKKVFFQILDSVPEFKDFYKNAGLYQIPQDLEFIKTACKYSLNIHTDKIARSRTDLTVRPHKRYDILPSPDILAFLYSKGRNPGRDVIRLSVDFALLIHSLPFKQFSDFRIYLGMRQQYANRLNIDKTNLDRKFAFRCDPETIQSINTILDFWRLTHNISIIEQKKYLSREIMSERYDLEYPFFSKEEAGIVHSTLHGILPSSIVDMILVK